jgi:Cu2+-containing amine oxidase
MNEDGFQERLHDLKEEQERQRDKCGEFSKALVQLIEAQKNTTRNVDALAADVKGVLKSTMHFELLEKKLELTNARVAKLETTATQCPVVLNDLKECQDHIKDIKKVDQNVITQRLGETEKDIKELQDSKSWGYKLIIGAVVMGIIGLIFDWKLHTLVSGG